MAENPLQRHARALKTGKPVTTRVLGNKVRLNAHPAMSPEQFKEHVIPREYSPDWEEMPSKESFNKNRDFDALVEDVKQHGVQEPVVLLPWDRDHPRYPEATGVVFDGHHRAAAAMRTGADIPYYTVHPDDEPYWTSNYDK